MSNSEFSLERTVIAVRNNAPQAGSHTVQLRPLHPSEVPDIFPVDAEALELLDTYTHRRLTSRRRYAATFNDLRIQQYEVMLPELARPIGAAALFMVRTRREQPVRSGFVVISQADYHRQGIGNKVWAGLLYAAGRLPDTRAFTYVTRRDNLAMQNVGRHFGFLPNSLFDPDQELQADNPSDLREFWVPLGDVAGSQSEKSQQLAASASQAIIEQARIEQLAAMAQFQIELHAPAD